MSWAFWFNLTHEEADAENKQTWNVTESIKLPIE